VRRFGAVISKESLQKATHLSLLLHHPTAAQDKLLLARIGSLWIETSVLASRWLDRNRGHVRRIDWGNCDVEIVLMGIRSESRSAEMQPHATR
jgi:hypothetical protein